MFEKQNPIRDREDVSRKIGTDLHLRGGCATPTDGTEEPPSTGGTAPKKALMEQSLRSMERYRGLRSLAAGLDHEIKNPLSALSLHVQLLQESLQQPATTASVRESLGVLATEVRRITGVLESFRDFASVAHLNRSTTNIRDLIDNLVTYAEPQARQQSVDINTALPEEDVLPFSMDAVRIEQVLRNLILNALEAMTEGGAITIRLRDQPDSVEIDVADTGGGIPDDMHDMIFDPYFTTRSTGAGMGLALCEKIIRQHEGTIDFTSGPGGTVFTVTLPRNATT